MLLGQKLKNAISESEFTTDEVADFIGITPNNLYRLYKKESFEVKYLLKAAEKLNKPLGYFLNDETIGAIIQSSSGNMVQQAARVGSNHQSINAGTEECQEKLEACKRENALLEKAIADKDMIIALLRGQQKQ